MKIKYDVRELEKGDLGEGFFEVLSNLTSANVIEKKRAEEIFDKIKNQSSYIYVAVYDDKIIGATTLLVEQKFIHDGGKLGHIEDVVTHKDFQGKGIGSGVMKKAIEKAKELGCYKIILDCSEKNVPFYERFGFVKDENCMRLDL
jgi:glucosamine-phosphate N-acetyltransferase